MNVPPQEAVLCLVKGWTQIPSHPVSPQNVQRGKGAIVHSSAWNGNPWPPAFSLPCGFVLFCFPGHLAGPVRQRSCKQISAARGLTAFCPSQKVNGFVAVRQVCCNASGHSTSIVQTRRASQGGPWATACRLPSSIPSALCNPAAYRVQAPFGDYRGPHQAYSVHGQSACCTAVRVRSDLQQTSRVQ